MGWAVKFEGVSKRYRGGGPRYGSLRHDLAQGFKRLGGLFTRNGRASRGTLALDDVSFEVRQGESLGIIGPNGAGKTTALKLISRISYPTVGRLRVRGRVGALIEVGAGVHPELTGRENVWLYGQILGMRKPEIRARFDEIVEFSGIASALDRPVKMYSSGMQLRLGFAIAVHLQPDIFVVDEALAVGDAEFQRKCLAKMREVTSQAATILFVSHNMTAIRAVCTQGILLQGGRITSAGSIDSVVDDYLRDRTAPSPDVAVEAGMFMVESVTVRSIDSGPPRTFGQAVINVGLRARSHVAEPGLYVGFLSTDDYRLAGLDFRDFTAIPPLRPGESVELELVIDRFPLMPGTYEIELHVKDVSIPRVEFVHQRFGFQVLDTPLYGGRGVDYWFGRVGFAVKAKVRVR